MTRPLIFHQLSSFPLTMLVSAFVQTARSYSNVTLRSPILSATVFMPFRENSAEAEYYIGSRFEHGSMIGDMIFRGDRVYGRGMWRSPHDPSWPESGVGLASEFGCGEDGSTCVGRGDIANGILGYEIAKAGEPFLKIGVGALIKGSCPDCDGNDEYRFNSPYTFYRAPSWEMRPSPHPNEITLMSEEVLRDIGYRIQKTVRIDGNLLTVRSLLTNLGKEQFTTPWYSHHFFTGDDVPLGPGYSLDLGLSEFGLKKPEPFFNQPGLGTWSGDLNEYANVTMAGDGSISVKVKKDIPDGVKLKADFLDENIVTITDGSFTLHAPNGISVYEQIPEVQTQSRNPFIYEYNLYAEKGTISPEPMLLLYLQPGETTSWTQTLKFTAMAKCSVSARFLPMLVADEWHLPHFPSWWSFVRMAICCAAVAALYTLFSCKKQSNGDYSSIPEYQPVPPVNDISDVI